MSMNGYLITRKEAAERYGLTVRGYEELYKRHPDFPIVRVGRKVLTNREMADKWFDDYIGENTEEYAT